jgi:hypothetical protein
VISPENVIRATLPKSWSEKKRQDLIDQIVSALSKEGLLRDGEVTLVEVADARMPVETIEAYGLTIALDALGDAAEISSPAGLVVLA